MNPDRQIAIQYVSAALDSPWRWAENGAVLVWQDGSTIAFREEVSQVLEWLAPNGLPPFGAVVFLLAACRGKVCSAADIFIGAEETLTTNSGQDTPLLRVGRQRLKAQLDETLEQLRAVERFPAELRSGIKARCVLAEVVFESAGAGRPVDAKEVLRGLKWPMLDEELVVTEMPDSQRDHVRQIHLVAQGLKPHTAESLTLRMRTGLDALPKEIDADLPSADRARRLIEELSRDHELGAVARAARDLSAAVRLPRRLAGRELLAIGGVADITNRGPLDRLLLSELAHDDLTLSVRVALNEALYLRREPPLREPPGMLALLLDSGVRLWGIPRVLAAAVALALVARDRQHGEGRVWRAHGARLEPVDLLSRKGLVEHLGALETNAHPGESLTAFADAVAVGPQNQTVLITDRDVLRDPEFRLALAAHPETPGFVAVVDRKGRFELHALPLSRRPPVCEADLNLASVFDDKVAVSLVKPDVDPDLPAIFGVFPFPFLLPLAGKVDFSITTDDGFTYAVLNDRRLVQFRNHRSGARVLASELPAGKTVWMGLVEGTVHVVKAGTNQRPTRLVSCRPEQGQLRIFDLPCESKLLAVHGSGDVLLLLHERDVRAHSLEDGRQLGRIANSYLWVNGRYFRGDEQFHFAVWDGASVKLEPVTIDGSYKSSVIATIFDRAGMEGPWILHHSGMVVSTTGGPRQQLPMPPNRTFGVDKVRVSRDGHRLCAQVSDERVRTLDLQTGQADTSSSTDIAHAVLDHDPTLPYRNVYRVIDAVAKLPDGLAVCGRKARWRKITLNGSRELDMIELPKHELELLMHITPFGEERRISGRGCTLKTARWNNGSRIHLDSRGMLHFRSHDPAVPEFSVVLAESQIAGWTADGLSCGPKFFFAGNPRTDAASIFGYLLHFLAHL